MLVSDYFSEDHFRFHTNKKNDNKKVTNNMNKKTKVEIENETGNVKIYEKE